MELLRQLTEQGEALGIHFLLVGGQALGQWGLSRQSEDVDILVSRADLPLWQPIVHQLDYSLLHAHPAYLRFSPPFLDAWPLDLILTNEETYQMMRARATALDLGAITVQTPSVEHLLAMKLHILKQGQQQRHWKDLADIMDMLDLGLMDAEGRGFQQLCTTFGRPGIYQHIQFLRQKRAHQDEGNR